MIDTSSLFIIAGPCVIESEDLCLRVAEHVSTICRRLGLGFVFKASFDKANRSSHASFRGLGVQEGLAILQSVKRKLGVALLTDVHEPAQAAMAAEVVDVLQVPAFLARQTDLLAACGASGRSVNIKKGQFMSPAEMGNAVAKVRGAGTSQVWLTERGTFFGYNRLVNDFTALPQMQALGCPVIFDITHSTQQPGGLGTASGGNPKYSPLLGRAAVAAGVDGIFLECHPDPKNARSDAATVLDLNDVESLLAQCARLRRAL